MAFLPVVFGVFDHGALLAFGGSLADSVFRVNARTSFRNPRRKCTALGRDAGPSNRGTGNRLCRSGGRRHSRQGSYANPHQQLLNPLQDASS